MMTAISIFHIINRPMSYIFVNYLSMHADFIVALNYQDILIKKPAKSAGSIFTIIPD